MPGTTKRMIRWASATAVAAGMVLAVAGPAQAYNEGDCDSFYGSANTHGDTFNVDTGTSGKVDFGDHSHWFGAPQGTAVVCWATNGRVMVRGQLFADSSSRVCVSAQLRFTRRDSTVVNRTTKSLCGKNAAAEYVSISLPSAGGSYLDSYNTFALELHGPDGEAETHVETR